jgi:hypothetical protein
LLVRYAVAHVSEETPSAEVQVARAISGMVAGGYAVDQDFEGGAIPCERCGAVLGAGDEVSAGVFDYEGHTWELSGVYCADHGVESVAETMGEGSDAQAVVAATLEPTGYHDPLGDHHPDAVSLGGVEVLDYSPMTYS